MKKMAKSKNTELSYEAALAELQAIVNQMQGEALGVDDLATKAKRASELIAYCKEKLRTTEKDIKDWLK